MDNYYEILHYLHNSKVDRHYPYDFSEDYVVENSSAVFPTAFDDYKGIDSVEAYLVFESDDIDVASISFGFSPLESGEASLLTLNAIPTTIIADTPTTIRFGVDTNARVADLSKLLTGVKSVKLDFADITGVKIIDIVLRTRDYTYTLKDLDKSYIDGENHVLRRLNQLQGERTQTTEIPESLKQYVFMAAGAYAWLSVWEYEAKPMKEPKSESNNYADRLFGQVDSALQNYLSSIENDPNKDYINMNLLCTTDVGWGIH